MLNLNLNLGFHWSENIKIQDLTLLRFAILGMTKAEIKRKFDEIVAFDDSRHLVLTILYPFANDIIKLPRKRT